MEQVAQCWLQEQCYVLVSVNYNVYNDSSSYRDSISTEKVAWDWVNEKLYWADACANDIEVYDPATRQRRVLFNSADGIQDPRGIVVDPTTGYVFALCSSILLPAWLGQQWKLNSSRMYPFVFDIASNVQRGYIASI